MKTLHIPICIAHILEELHAKLCMHIKNLSRDNKRVQTGKNIDAYPYWGCASLAKIKALERLLGWI